MLSLDNFVQASGSTQGFNRYSYGLNNPLKYVDPDGELAFLALAFVMYGTDFGYNLQKMISPVAVKINVGIGSDVRHFGIEISVGLPKFLPMSRRDHIGFSIYSTSSYDGISSGKVINWGTEASTLNGLFSVSSMHYKSFSSKGDNTSQNTSVVNIGLPGLLNIRYENDWMPPFLSRLGEDFDGDVGDRYRSAAMKITAGQFNWGFNIGTGDPNLVPEERKKDILFPYGPHAGKQIYTSGTIDKYRLGIKKFGNNFFSFGTNSEKNRHGIQNLWAHDKLQDGKAPHIRILSRIPRRFWYVGTGFGTGLW